MNWSFIILGKMTDVPSVSDGLQQTVCFGGPEIGLFGRTNLMLLEKLII